MGWDAGGVNAVSCYLYGVAALLSLWHVFERSRLEHDLNARLRPLEASGQHARVRRRMRLFSLFLFCGLVTRCAWFALRESGFGGDECKKILVCPDWLLLVLDRFSTLAFFVAYTLLVMYWAQWSAQRVLPEEEEVILKGLAARAKRHEIFFSTVNVWIALAQMAFVVAILFVEAADGSEGQVSAIESIREPYAWSSALCLLSVSVGMTLNGRLLRSRLALLAKDHDAWELKMAEVNMFKGGHARSSRVHLHLAASVDEILHTLHKARQRASSLSENTGRKLKDRFDAIARRGSNATDAPAGRRASDAERRRSHGGGAGAAANIVPVRQGRASSSAAPPRSGIIGVLARGHRPDGVSSSPGTAARRASLARTVMHRAGKPIGLQGRRASLPRFPLRGRRQAPRGAAGRGSGSGSGGDGRRTSAIVSEALQERPRLHVSNPNDDAFETGNHPTAKLLSDTQWWLAIMQWLGTLLFAGKAALLFVYYILLEEQFSESVAAIVVPSFFFPVPELTTVAVFLYATMPPISGTCQCLPRVLRAMCCNVDLAVVDEELELQQKGLWSLQCGREEDAPAVVREGHGGDGRGTMTVSPMKVSHAGAGAGAPAMGFDGTAAEEGATFVYFETDLGAAVDDDASVESADELRAGDVDLLRDACMEMEVAGMSSDEGEADDEFDQAIARLDSMSLTSPGSHAGSSGSPGAGMTPQRRRSSMLLKLAAKREAAQAREGGDDAGPEGSDDDGAGGGSAVSGGGHSKGSSVGGADEVKSAPSVTV